MSLVTAVKTRMHAHRLDAALAAGADPASDPELQPRAAHLTSLPFRNTLATRLENAVSFPTASRYANRTASSLVVHAPAAVTQLASPLARRLAAELRAAEAPSAQGVALAVQLVTDGDSSLDVGPTVDNALAAVQEARAAL